MLTTCLDPAVASSSEVDDETLPPSLTFLNATGDITITWDPSNDEKIKDLVRARMKEGYVFFTLRKVIIDSVKVKRKVGTKGVDTITSLIIEDADFDKLVKDMDDRDVARLLLDGDVQMGKRRGKNKEFTSIGRAKTAEDVVNNRQALAIRPVVGG